MTGNYENSEGKFTFEINELEGYCLVVATGKISFSSSVNAMMELVKDDRFRNEFAVIVDLRHINYNPTYDEILGIKNKLIFLKQNFENKIALVTTGFLSVLGELICRLTHLSGMKMSSFNDIDQAKDWVMKHN